MATHFNCVCEERKKQIHDRAWVITEYKWNSGAFVSGGGEYSDWSSILCLECGSSGRSKSKYVDKLEIMNRSEAREEERARRNKKIKHK